MTLLRNKNLVLHKLKKTTLTLSIILVAFSLRAQVRVWEEDISIPTLKVGQPSEHPTFKRDINMRADDDQIYPYTYNYKITDEYENKTYLGCFLENKYIKVLVTPDIGGKLYGALDKTNNYDFIYWQPTVKPALISLTGPWVSGGIEWCFPSGHRQTGYQTIAHQLSENADGSKTIWVGETEWVHGLSWRVGLTAYPGKSVLVANIKLMNHTNMPQSQYMWANAATHADSSYQLIYPTNTMTTHNRTDFYHWPKNEGVDISWWKNIPNASSYFAEDIASFFGGYNHKQDAGTAFVGNKHIMTGKKFWTWGASPSGRLWDWVLSDEGGPYVEPQFGAFTTNQPDYHWLNPGEIKDFDFYLFPVKGIGAYKEANINGALNLEFSNDSLLLGVYSTSELTDGIVKLLYNNEVVFTKTISIDPATPFQATIQNKKNNPSQYTLLLLNNKAEYLISYSPENKKSEKLPEGEKPIITPSAYNSPDEIWNLGEFLYKNRDRNKAEEFFSYVLKKDSLDTRTNISLAQMAIEEGDYKEALQYLNKAEKRDKDNGKLYYLKGIAFKSLGMEDDAYDAFYKSTHFQEFVSTAYKELVFIDLKNKSFLPASTHIDKAIENNLNNPELLILKAIISHATGKNKLALTFCDEALKIDPMNFWGINEKIKILEALNKPVVEEKEQLNRLLLNDFQYFLQLAGKYIEIGDYQETINICFLFETETHKKNSLLSYYKGFCFDQLNKKALAKDAFQKAEKAPTNNIFPFRRKTIDVLAVALQYNPSDANANYFMGLVYAGLSNGEKAFAYLTRASELNPGKADTWRNMGYLKNGYPGVKKNLNEARIYYERAFNLKKQDDLILMELDQIREALKEDPVARLNTLKGHIEVVETNDDLLGTMIDLMVSQKEFEIPRKYFSSHTFNNREGKYRIHNSYMSAYIGMAKKEKATHKALEYYQLATKYPDNLKVKPNNPDLRGFLYFPMAMLNEELGNREERKRLLEITASENTVRPTIANYYRALALRELKRDIAGSHQAINQLHLEAESLMNGKTEDYLNQPKELLVALGHYYLALCHNFNGHFQEEYDEQKKALKLHYTIEQDAIMIAQQNYK